MTGRDIIERLIRQRAQRYELDVEIRWQESFESGAQIVSVGCGTPEEYAALHGNLAGLQTV